MSRKTKTNGTTALATVADAAAPARQIARGQANELLKARALELYHEARSKREQSIRAFEAEYGRADRIDHTILADLQRVQARLAAIAARQQRAGGYHEPKVSKHVETLGQLIGSISSYLATERALELFAPVQQSDYVGFDGRSIGPKGRDESVLVGYQIVDDPNGPSGAAPTAEADDEACMHAKVAPYDDEPSYGACIECGEEFEIRTTPAEGAESDVTRELDEKEPAREPAMAE